MKKFLFLIILVVSSMGLMAQSDLRAKSIQLVTPTGQPKITKVTTNMNSSDSTKNTMIPTAKAVSDYVIQHDSVSLYGWGADSAFAMFGLNSTVDELRIRPLTQGYMISLEFLADSSIRVKLDTNFVAQWVRGSSWNLYSKTLINPSYGISVSLTDGATVTWDWNSGTNSTVTIAGNRTLAISNPVAGGYGTIKVIQGTGGSRTLSLPASSKVMGGGAGVVTLSTAVGAIDILTVYYDGTNYFWTYSTNFN